MSAELLLGMAAGVVVGVVTKSIGSAIVAVLVTALGLVVLGSAVFAASSGLEWLRRRGASLR